MNFSDRVDTILTESILPPESLIKFLETDQDSFVRIAGYTSRLEHVLKLWQDDHPGFIQVALSGNMFHVQYDGPIIPTPWSLFTPGNPGRPNNNIQDDHLEEILSAPTPEEGQEIWARLGYKKYSGVDDPTLTFTGDIVGNVQAHESEQGEVIVNVECQHTMLAKPYYHNNKSGYNFFKKSDFLR